MRDKDRGFRLLELLADGEMHSGETLGNALGVTRAAVWKLVRQLREQGVPVHADRRHGYHLPTPVELLHKSAVETHMDRLTRSRVSEVRVEFSVDSTNARLLAEAGTADHPIALLAEQQTAGRGRRGRPWQSPFGGNLYLSLLWPMDQVPGGLSGLSLVVGMAVVDALSNLGIPDLALKWPNDVVWRQRKLAGILVEMHGQPDGLCAVVPGIGLNVHVPEGGTIDQPWVDLAGVHPGALPSRSRIAAGLIDAIASNLAQFATSGFEPFAAAWFRYDALADAQVRVEVDGRDPVSGTARGVDTDGALLLERAGAVERWTIGEVSVRRES